MIKYVNVDEEIAAFISHRQQDKIKYLDKILKSVTVSGVEHILFMSTLLIKEQI